MTALRVAGIQLDIAWEDPERSFERARPWIEAAAKTRARLIVLPEMFACGFSMNTAAIAEPPDGPSVKFLHEQAAMHDLWICGSVPELPHGASSKPFNTLVLVGPDGQTHRYRKIHPFTHADEHLHYGAGDELIPVEIEGLRCSFFICYDLRFADELWQLAPETDCYLVVANWPSKRRAHWSALLRARAIENQAYVVGINRVGSGGSLEYSGDSHIIDPYGETLAAAAWTQTLLVADVDPAVVAEAREHFPFLRDRR
jgi:predicted amidohydrolase